jgi:predicted DNA-binding protein (UPF0251 family)
MFQLEAPKMPRPICCRRISGVPAASVFKPAGVPWRTLDQVVLTLDEFEAIRLADLKGLYQEQAAEFMRISRPTFGRIIDAARRKIAEAVTLGKALRIEGGTVYTDPGRSHRCENCDAEWYEALGDFRKCPACRRKCGEQGTPSGCRGQRRRRGRD